MDYYKILGILPNAEQEVVKAVYRALMKIHHTDLGGSDAEAKLINAAYEVLGDPAKREKYDRDLKKTPPKAVGGYRILEQIAEGGLGITYKAEHLLSGKLVCIKQCSEISSVSEAILLEEARAMWDLRHFSIPAMRDILKFADGSIGLVMSYIPGRTLAQGVEKVGRIDPEHVAWITERLINVLKYLHYNGVVHGDVKPQNVIVQAEDHTVVLVDYGLSMVKPTSASKAAGFTPYFAPPEQQDRKGQPLVPESDFYSLGMTLIYLLNGGNLDRLKNKEIPSGVPKPFVDLIKRLIVKDVLSRPSWENEDLAETISRVRKESFGRTNSGMKPLNF